MQIGNRPLPTVLRSAFQKRNYVALLNMHRSYPAFWENLRRYLSGKGAYPYRIEIRTPTGSVSPILYSNDDLLGVNEIFCRQDYFAGTTVKVVVDVGSNIGLSALYFLTRNRESACYLFEPDTRNVQRLRLNLIGFESRYFLREVAIWNYSGKVQFGLESTGRYGGIGIQTSEQIKVNCLDVNTMLREILDKETVIDILKIDTEGAELSTVRAIETRYLMRIRRIYLESHPAERLHPAIFDQQQYGGVCQLTNRALCI
jgi:FkbM family methyltransferase